jgi:hypothetical protein
LLGPLFLNSDFICFSSDVSRDSEVSISIYLRHPPSGTASKAQATNDFFLGAVKIQPNLETTKLDDQILTVAGGTGAMAIQLCYKPQQVRETCSLRYGNHVGWR